MKKFVLIFGLMTVWLITGMAQSDGSVSFSFSNEDQRETVVYLVRHAEKGAAKGAMMSKDPGLTAQGKARAKALARLLKDAGIDYVFSSDYKRTRNTAQPIAKLLGVEVELYDPRNLDELSTIIKGKAGRYLVVGHSNTTPSMVELLGGQPGTPIKESEYDRLYTVVLTDGAEPVTVLLRYGKAK